MRDGAVAGGCCARQPATPASSIAAAAPRPNAWRRTCREKGIEAVAFHAGLPPEQKRAAAARFRSGEPVVVVATIAFGMGIDRPDVRFVVHLDMPDSPEAYYQQIGRAGRDGDPADTLLLYGGEDIARARHWLAQSSAPDAQKRGDAPPSGSDDRADRDRAVPHPRPARLLRRGTSEKTCGHCDNCVAPARTFDGTIAAQKVLSAVFRTGQRFGAKHVVQRAARRDQRGHVCAGRTTSCRRSASVKTSRAGSGAA